jgi:rubrerythrin
VNTDDNLKTAFSAEAMAYMKYSAFANVAEKEGLVQAAKFFRSLAEAEKVHAMNHLALMNEKTDTEQNIMNSIDNETYEFTQTYPSFIKQADNDGNSLAAAIFKQAMAVERSHGNLLSGLLENFRKDREYAYYICTVCGNITERYAPERCPICNSAREKFKAIE